MESKCNKCKKRLKEMYTENNKFCYRISINGRPYLGLRCKYVDKNFKPKRK